MLYLSDLSTCMMHTMDMNMPKDFSIQSTGLDIFKHGGFSRQKETFCSFPEVGGKLLCGG